MSRYISQEVCPFVGSFSVVGAESDYAARPAWEAEWDAYTRGSAMRRAGYSGLRRNVDIALGNWLAGMDTPDPEAVGQLVEALSDEDPLVAEAKGVTAINGLSSRSGLDALCLLGRCRRALTLWSSPRR